MAALHVPDCVWHCDEDTGAGGSDHATLCIAGGAGGALGQVLQVRDDTGLYSLLAEPCTCNKSMRN